jgi:hypothetical protein
MIHPIHADGKNRSLLCHVITDFHSTRQKRLAQFDGWGMTISALLAALVVEVVRVVVSH